MGCMICGYRYTEKDVCDWCNDDRFVNVIKALDEEISSSIETYDVIDVKNNPLFSLVADVGILGVKHPLLSMPYKILSKLMLEVGRGRRYVNKGVLRFGQRDIEPFLYALKSLGLVDFKDEGVVYVPDTSILLRLKIEADVDPKRNPVTAFLIGYITLKKILETILLFREDKKIEFGDGVTCFYSISVRDGGYKFIMPKSFMSSFSFIFGYWARGAIEFSELDIKKFMTSRGITGKEFSEIIGLLSSSVGIPHAFYERINVEKIGKITIYRFRLNKEYERLYLRIRERTRALER